MVLEYYSISRLNSFLRCPKNFYFQYIEKIQPEPNKYIKRGKALHSVLEELNKVFLFTGGNFKIRLNSLIDFYLNQNLLDPSEYRNLFVKFSKNYIENYLNNFFKGHKFIYIENEFNYNLENIRFKGIFDLVTKKDDNIFLIDFKTVSQHKNMILELQKDLQIQFYRYVLQNSICDNCKIYLGHIQFSFKQQTIEKYLIDYYDNSIINQIKQIVNRIENSIKENNFPKKEGYFCRYCSFRKFCLKD